MTLDTSALSFVVATSSDPEEVTIALDQLIELSVPLPPPRVTLPSSWVLRQLRAPLYIALYAITHCDDPAVLAKFVARARYQDLLPYRDDIFYALAINPATSAETQLDIAIPNAGVTARVHQALLERMRTSAPIETRFAESLSGLTKDSSTISLLSLLQEMSSARHPHVLDEVLIRAIEVENKDIPKHILHNRYFSKQSDETRLNSNCSYPTTEILSMIPPAQAEDLAEWLLSTASPLKPGSLQHTVPFDGPLMRKVVSLVKDPANVYRSDFINHPQGTFQASCLTSDAIDVLLDTPLWRNALHAADLNDTQFTKLLETTDDLRPILLRMDNDFGRSLPPKRYFSQLLSSLPPDQLLHRTDWPTPVLKSCTSARDPLFTQLLDHATGFLVYNYLVGNLLINNQRIFPAVDDLPALARTHALPEHTLLFSKAPATAKLNEASDTYVAALIDFIPGAAVTYIEQSDLLSLDDTGNYIADRLQATGHSLKYALGQLFAHREASLASMCRTLSTLATSP